MQVKDIFYMCIQYSPTSYFVDYIAKTCPHYDLLEQIMCNRKSVNPKIFDELFQDTTEMEDIEYLEDETTSQSQLSEFAANTPTTSTRFLSDLQGFNNSTR